MHIIYISLLMFDTTLIKHILLKNIWTLFNRITSIIIILHRLQQSNERTHTRTDKPITDIVRQTFSHMCSLVTYAATLLKSHLVRKRRNILFAEIPSSLCKRCFTVILLSIGRSLVFVVCCSNCSTPKPKANGNSDNSSECLSDWGCLITAFVSPIIHNSFLSAFNRSATMSHPTQPPCCCRWV